MSTSTACPHLWKSALAGGLATAAFLYLLRKQMKLNERINGLALQVLSSSKSDIQTLCGASSRKDWIKKHPEHKDWAASLLSVQQSNALSAPSRPNNAKNQVLYDAAEHDNLSAAEAAVSKGYSPNVEEELHPKFGTTPLMEAAFHGRNAIVKLLIENNAELNVQSGYGWTALHYAGQAKMEGCAALLVAAGADRAIKNNKGKTAYERAVEQDKKGIAALLI